MSETVNNTVRRRGGGERKKAWFKDILRKSVIAWNWPHKFLLCQSGEKNLDDV